MNETQSQLKLYEVGPEEQPIPQNWGERARAMFERICA